MLPIERPTETSLESESSTPEPVSGNSSDTRGSTARSRIRYVLAAMLGAYWISMFVGTHIPSLPTVLAHQWDKLLHFGAYAGLAVLLLGWRACRGQFGARTILILWLLLAAYGMFDEFTQRFVGRGVEVYDWFSDLAGAACGLVVGWFPAAWIRNWLVRPAAPKP